MEGPARMLYAQEHMSGPAYHIERLLIQLAFIEKGWVYAERYAGTSINAA
jgi:hypothetical protein